MAVNGEKNYIVHMSIIGFIALLISPALFPSLRLTFFAPFLVYMCYKAPKVSALWAAVICGIVVDIFAAHTAFGVHALNYTITTWFLYKKRNLFAKESILMLPIMTAVFSLCSTTLQAFLLNVFGEGLAITLHLILADFFVMSIYDGIYAFALFVPMLAYLRRKPSSKTPFVRRPQ
ncbi:MAG: rod shape-determining protein MreD [Waddliaceae bacterium]|jgi:rod shape-determining protein MreD|nr:rod shape-determining protein MreD [Waddliaceae bacterium]MBT3579421.1 rod shape-determining protein MreD [Waddliaceae bacterium]MBT4444476.1 rod shape-determining protein MreD [Waddliaceae bacterium]MBT6929096.1 rod shape-determining protein MreD [Waddliaceae bacterium]MBT7264544.1 rod shape-determining protein MreD [Waddliaceae bacterium]